jgi:geranylgeranyl transferase type-2 subunit beta
VTAVRQSGIVAEQTTLPKAFMTSTPFLLDLAIRLQQGARAFQAEFREKHARFFRAMQLPDGGFRGREGDSDLYYTSFAVRGLAMLDELTADDCQSIGRYLKGHQWRQLGVIDLMNWLATALAVQAVSGFDPLADEVAGWPEEMADKLEAVRTKDGGYAKSTEGASGSTYHSFLVALTYELLSASPPGANALGQFLFDRQRDDGGFVEIAPMRRSGTNPTAAAVVLLDRLGLVDDEVTSDVTAFLQDVWSDEGGFSANSRVPFADGLSTFTGLLTLWTLNRHGEFDLGAIAGFIRSLELPTGGFRAASWDETADVEYTFYALATAALLRGLVEGISGKQPRS